MHRAWERWLRGSSPTLSVTFEQEAAVENANAVLLSLGHPLLRQAAEFLHEANAVAVHLSVVNEVLPKGLHPFALYHWTRQGVRRDEELIPVAESLAVADALLEVLPYAVDAPWLEHPAQRVWDDLDKVHHQLWLRESSQHAEDNRQLVGVRIQSLTASFAARRALLEEQIGRATNDKIRVMKQAEFERAQVDYDTRVVALRKAAESGDIKATPTVFGVIEVRRD